MSKKALLEMKRLTKLYPGVTALDEVSFQIKEGELHALVGENGAGKSTLIKILSGAEQATSGSFSFKGQQMNLSSPLQAKENGISVVHQELKLVETLSVAENIFLGRPVTKKPIGLIDKKQQMIQAKKLLDNLNAKLDVSELVVNLSVAQKQLVEICKALSYQAELIIMDEPSATLTDSELDILFSILKQLREQGVTIIYISHRLEEVFKLADRVTILRDGKHIITDAIDQFNRRSLIEYMVGRKVENEYPKMEVAIGELMLEVHQLGRSGVFDPIDLTLQSGEILGIAGLVGSGRTEFVRALFGADKKTSGTIKIRGKEVQIKKVHESIKNKIALVPEERKSQGVVIGMSIRENISLVGIKQIMSHGILNSRKEKNLANRYIQLLKIATPSDDRIVRNLSGGNQQKVVLAKWMAIDADILILDEPTRGIDVGAKAEIYSLMSKFVQEGKAIIMVSSELPELIGMCDRILTMHEGKITGEILRKDATQERIMEYATKAV